MIFYDCDRSAAGSITSHVLTSGGLRSQHDVPRTGPAASAVCHPAAAGTSLLGAGQRHRAPPSDGRPPVSRRRHPSPGQGRSILPSRYPLSPLKLNNKK